MQLQKKALEALQGLSVQDMTAKDIKEYIKMATDLERLNREITEDDRDGVIYQMEIEDLDDVERDIYGNGKDD